MATVKPIHKLTLRDRLSQLDFDLACKLLGSRGSKLILHGAKREIDLVNDVDFGADFLRVRFPVPDGGIEAETIVTLSEDSRKHLSFQCDRCDVPCEHLGAMFSLVLESKTELGLAKPPAERETEKDESEDFLVGQAVAARVERAKKERMRVRSQDASSPWTDYTVTSLVSGRTYRVALRGLEPGKSYCSCPDFRTNTLGTCKHVIKTIAVAKRKFGDGAMKRPFRLRRIEVHLDYAGEISLRLAAPAKLEPRIESIVGPLLNQPILDVPDLIRRFKRLAAASCDFHVFPDAEEFIQQRLHAERIRATVEEIRRDPARHPLRESLLKIPLLPYQMDGIAFVVGAARAVLADDMGLGKTIQGVGVAELLAREAGIRKVLVICPASLKSQWRNEVHRFCDRSVQLVSGRIAERAAQYANDRFFTVCNYEQVLRDILAIEKSNWDLIILDEGQRIKNWEAKTSRVIKGLKSRFALVLSGTPLENRLDDLFSIVQFVDDRRLGPGFRFFHQHRMTDEKGKVLGYKNLAQLRTRLAPILLRRTRESVKLELPERTTEFVRIPPTAEQKEVHDAHLRIVAQIVRKRFISEMDLIRLRVALLMCRMAADGTYLITKEKPNHSSKLERLVETFEGIAEDAERKVVLFSEWTTMLDLIEPILKRMDLGFVRLDGSVPTKQRQALVHQFQTEPGCRFFLTTNAGSTGLNLQAANTVINVDLPWNPAVLEQRIARAHRMGQKQPVHAIILVTEETLEENLLATLSSKKELALAALDSESDVDAIELTTGADELKAKLEILLGAKCEAPLVDKELPGKVEPRRDRVAEAGVQLLTAAITLFQELSGVEENSRQGVEGVLQSLQSKFEPRLQNDPNGQPRLSLALPDADTMDQFKQLFSRFFEGPRGA